MITETYIMNMDMRLMQERIKQDPVYVKMFKEAGYGEPSNGSERSYGGLMTALDIAARPGAEVHAVAAYDPYYHYVAFNKIAGVLSEEAGKVFRFKEQEKLHEELIDDAPPCVAPCVAPCAAPWVGGQTSTH